MNLINIFKKYIFYKILKSLKLCNVKKIQGN